MHFRGCSGVPNKLGRIYHSGETEDGTFFLRWLDERYGTVPTAAVGYSLGGNMLGCLMAEIDASFPLTAGVIVSAPFMLEHCCNHMEKRLFTLLSVLSAEPAESQRHPQAEGLARHAAD